MEHQTLHKALQSTEISHRFKNIFTNNFLNNLGYFTGFLRRQGVIDGEKFVCSCIEMALEAGWGGSLNKHCILLKSRYGIEICEQSLNERFNKQGVEMMRYLFEQVMRIQFRQGNPMDLLGCFEEVYIEDSTNVELPAVLKHLFKGSGGGASEAGLKIDANYGMRWGTMEVMFHGSAGSDNWQHVPAMKKGSLLIRDLGYHNLGDFDCISKAGSYFLSRYKYGTKVYSGAGGTKEISLLTLLEGMEEGETKDMVVFIGEKKRLKVRMVLQKVPWAVAEGKRLKLRTDKQNKRKNLSEDRLTFCAANCYITNIPIELVGTGHISVLYGLRWIIEVLFKAWKSISNLNEKVNSMTPQRFMCMLYAHMIRTLVDTKVVHYFKVELWNLSSFKVSELKAFEVMDSFRHKWWDALKSGVQEVIEDVFRQIADTIQRFAEKRKYGKNENHNDFYIFVKMQT